jgi:mannose-6-phosphate isomerase-like protein (cupin superfamily)
MKSFASVAFLAGAIVGYSAGTLGPRASVVAAAATAQSQTGAQVLTRPGDPALAPDQPAEGQYWDIADLNKIHADRLVSGVARGPHPLSRGMRSRTHSINLLTRLYHEKPVSAAFTGRMSEFDNGEVHEGVTDIYVITGGSGRVMVGGELQNKVNRPAAAPGSPLASFLLPGEFVGQPVVGGKTFQVKPGDIVNIPPGLAHWAKPDRNGLTYMLIKVNVGLYPWSAIAGLQVAPSDAQGF